MPFRRIVPSTPRLTGARQRRHRLRLAEVTASLRAALRRSPFDGPVTAADRLSGGTVNAVWLVRWADGCERVVKHAERVPADLFPVEARGLAALAGRGGLSTPEVLHYDSRLLVLEPLRAADGSSGTFWADAGRAVASLHLVKGSRYGWSEDGWLGRLRQENRPAEDGYEFFAHHRVLRYLREPAVQRALTVTDRSAIERLCARLPELVPPAGPVLTHGDLWAGNVLATAAGTPALIDPAVSWMWPDIDLSMFYCTADRGVADRFFGGYREVRPLDPGWRRRMPLLHLRELLSTIAHDGDRWGAVDRVRAVSRRFETR